MTIIMRFLKNKKHDNQHTNPSPNNQDVKDKSKGLKRIKQSVLHKIALCGSAILLFLSSCNSTAIVEQAPVEEIRTLQTNKTPELSTPTKELQNTVEVTEEVPTPTIEATPTEEVEATPEKEFDESTLNLVEWPNYELVETETFENLETVHIKEGTRIFAFPYYEENFSHFPEIYNPSVKEFNSPKDLHFQIGEKRTIQNENGESVTVGIVAGTTSVYSTNNVFAVIMKAQDSNGVIKDFSEHNSSDLRDKNIITNILIKDTLRENEFNSSLLSIYRFTKYQEENGMFLANQEYSMEDILSPFEDFEKYPFYPESKNPLYILGSSGLSSSLSVLFRNNPEIGEVVVSKQGPLELDNGPFSGEQEKWGVNMNADSPFTFKLNKDGYFIINHVVLPVGKVKESQLAKYPELLSDYWLFYTLTFIDSQDVTIKTSDEFIYDEESGSVTPILLNDVNMISHYVTDNAKLKELACSLYTPISVFAE